MKRLYRSKKETKVFGICGGIADYLDVDPTFVRIVAVAVAVISGFFPFVFGYFIACLIIPVDSDSGVSFAKEARDENI
jgi:phage shock protein PspC (stress-responsive transcriptional regulator)